MKFFPCALILFLSVAIIASGCARFHAKESESSLPVEKSIVTTNQQTEGYALLFDLVDKERNVSKILIIKQNSAQLKAVIKRIAETSKVIANELETLAKEKPALELKFTHLPVMEQKARDLIEKQMGKELLKTSDVLFEFKLLQSQIEGMNYGAHLAAALLETETDLKRRDFLKRTQTSLTDLHDEIYRMVLNRYIR